MPEMLELDFMTDDQLTGFRLQRLEVFNWGTFDQRIWTLHLNGRNGLLTGDIGCGKSTLVDAVTTLLVPSQRIAYNKAAGADSRERTLKSYVLGYYKSERQDSLGSAKPVALRDANSYSVILGVFHNAGYDKTVTLAQVFWSKEVGAQPARLYVAAEHDLTIASHFTNFGSDISALRKQLRNQHVELFDSFPPYGAWFRRRFGIHNEQALELFHQTVSLKSVGNLTEFVRTHMLKPFDVQTRIHALIDHFEDLNRAHEAVLKAKQQVAMLEPLIADWRRYCDIRQQVEHLRACRDALRPWFAQEKLGLLQTRCEQLAQDLTRQDMHIRKLNMQRDEQRLQERDLRRALAENGGDRLERLAQDIAQKEQEAHNRKEKADRYGELLAKLDRKPVDNNEAFLQQQTELRQWREEAATRQADIENDLTACGVSLREQREQYKKLSAEITGLKARVSNIDEKQIHMRSRLCQALALQEEDMPFAGELLQVRETESAWEGAIERLLHSFGLSLLVPDKYYAQVAAWVDDNALRGRLVYFRVRESDSAYSPQLHPNSLIHKIQIKPDSAFYPWMEREIARRFDVACCETQEQFRREKRAITLSGQSKTSDERHEKDDRHALHDRSRYVLGWHNGAKIATLEKKARQQETEIGALAKRVAVLQKQKYRLLDQLQTLTRLDEHQHFADMDWQSVAKAIERLRDEVREIEAASDQLAVLTAQLNHLEQAIATTEQKLDRHKSERAKIEQKISDSEELQQQTQALLAETAVQNEQYFSAVAEIHQEALGEKTLRLESCDKYEREMRDWLQAKIDNEDGKQKRLAEKIVKAMTEYKNHWILETSEVDARLDAAEAYQAMLEQLRTDDLPRFEQRFKALLNENTIREVANFHSQLAREQEIIKDRIAKINQSLIQIDYNPGRYIMLDAQPNRDVDIRDFQTNLRTCTEGTLSGSEDAQYSESKFLQVKQIIERFRGRHDHADADRRWTAKVCDVRHWFVFAASERWREDDSEHENYPDSGGKSGGQKEKLAYTVLAASLAYQFGLEWNAVRSRSFRFVAIDEAFGRGSDESAQYGLQLFAQLNLQLLIVTPLQKIHVIEPFVSAVGFVHNENGHQSVLRNLRIEDYRAERERIQG